MRPLLLLVCCAASGCLFLGGSSDTEPPVDLAVAVGARLTLRLDRCGSSGGGRVCVDFDPEEVTAVTPRGGDAFEVGDYRRVDRVIEIPLHATQPGETTVRVSYEDIFGRQTRDIRLRAAEVTHALLDINCESFSGSTESMAITAGTEFGFHVHAMAGETPLLSGDLELVTAEGFAVTAPGDDLRRATAPHEPGTYRWSLAGESHVDLVIYDPADLEPTLASEAGFDGTTTVRVGRAVDGTPVCIHGSPVRAVVEVTEGPCLPATSYAEVVGPMPINLGQQAWSFTLATAAAASCTVEARIDGGGTVAATFEATARATEDMTSTPIPAEGYVIEHPLPAESSCSGSLSDGDCDGEINYPPIPTDGDCYIDSDWSISHRDGTRRSDDAIGDDDWVGVGLVTELRLLIVADVLGLVPIVVGPPQSMTYTISPAGSIEVTSLGCSSDDRDEVLKIVALEESSFLGELSIDFEAANLDDDAELSFRARNVDAAVFDSTDLDGWRSPSATAPDVDFFTGSRVGVSVGYRGGGQPLRGSAPVVITTDSPTAGMRAGAIHTGDTPGTTITITAPAAPAATGVQRIHVWDESSIADVGDLEFSVTTAVGDRYCKELWPRLAGGRRLYGARPLPRITLTGSGYVMGDGFSGEFCLEGFVPGPTTMTVSWGNATVQRTWTVTP